VVQFASGAGRPFPLLASLPATRTVGAPAHRYLIRVDSLDAAGVVASLRSHPGVRYAEVAQKVHAAQTTPDDPCYLGCPTTDDNGSPVVANEDYLNTIGAPQAWEISKGSGVTVAVLDSGVDPNQPDLAGKIVGQHDVCAADDSLCASPEDQLGHGTHVTGILAADTNNNLDVASLGWDVSVDEYKVLDSQGDGDTADVATAIYEAVAAGDRVINMSLANFSCQADPTNCGPDPDEEAAVEYAIAHGVVVVAAAGNDGFDSDTYPASYPGVLSVAATDDSGSVQPFSQWGSAANIAAPGLNIVSTWPTYAVAGSACQDLCIESGTSMAAPQVSAAAALLISADPSLSGAQVTELLESTARPTTGGNPINGGLLDVPAALAAESNPPHLFDGYELAGANGSVYSFGSLGHFGDASGVHLAQPVVGEAVDPNGEGYWLVAKDGGVFSYGQAAFYGSTGSLRLAKPVVGMAATPGGGGYWLVAADGGVFSFGDARFYGSTGGLHLAAPVVGMAATPDGGGYWLVAADGGVFSFGDARFYGSTGNLRLAKPIVGMAAGPGGAGYWLVASDGGVFTFGGIRFYGSTGGEAIPAPVVADAS
jgi:hypothetical protein